jgi:hypothetical protein
VPLDEPLKNVMNEGRIISVGFDLNEPNVENRTGLYSYNAKSLSLNYATLWGLFHFNGYEPMISKHNNEATLGFPRESVSYEVFNKTPLPYDYFRKWGVRWYVVSRNVELPRHVGLIRNVRADNT